MVEQTPKRQQHAHFLRGVMCSFVHSPLPAIGGLSKMSAKSSKLRPAAPLAQLCFAMVLAFCAPAAYARADTRAPAVAAQPAGQVCLGGIWTRIFHPIERGVGNQAGMIRFGIIALVSALYIIWWRR